MHSASAILAQSTIRSESNVSKIIHPYWQHNCNLDSFRHVSFVQYLLNIYPEIIHIKRLYVFIYD